MPLLSLISKVLVQPVSLRELVSSEYNQVTVNMMALASCQELEEVYPGF